MRQSSKISFAKKILGTIAIAATMGTVLTGCGNKDGEMIRTGQIEMREYDVASKIPGRVEWIGVDEGDAVEINQPLFRLTMKEIQAKVNQAKGAVESAQAQYSMSLKGARQEQIDMAEKGYSAAKSQFELAEKTFKRMKNLHNDKLISDQELDVANQKLSGARAQMEAALSQYNMAKSGTRIEEKQMALGQYDRAKEALNEAKSYMDESTVFSLYKGIVAKRYADAGELVATGYPVITIIDPQDAWAELNLPATELEKLKIGMVVKGKIHGIGRTEEFKVVSFAAMSDFANWRATKDKATFDVRSFTVKLRPVNKNIESLRPGMTVSFDLNHLK